MMAPRELPADLDEAINASRERLEGLGSTILFYPTVGSTNDVALSLAARGDADGALVIADEQTAGRGRRGRVWFSPPGSGLYVSLVLTPGRSRVDPERATTLLTLAAGVALAEGIESAAGLRVDIKWPNDLLVGRRKLAGILAEAAAESRPVLDPSERHVETTIRVGAPRGMGTVILGYGINVGPMAYPLELADRATSLETELGRRVDRATICVETLAAIARRYDDLLAGRFDAILDAWCTRAPSSRNAKVTWPAASGPMTGVTAGIDDRGALLVRVGERVERIVGGEIHWL